MRPSLTLNCDLGETDHIVPQGPEHLAMPYIHMANIACGFHAGNRQTMLDTIALAQQHQVLIGAHPSYPDRENFGRQSMQLSQADVCDLVFQQIDTLDALAEVHGARLSYVKPHGALYHDLLHDEATRLGVFQGVASLSTELPVLVLAGAHRDRLLTDAAQFGLTLWFEAFADRRYHADGRLQYRGEEGAVLTNAEEIIAQATAIAHGEPITSIEDEPIIIVADSLCVHGDNAEAVATIKAIRAALTP